MPSIPSDAAYSAARLLHQQAVEAETPGKVIISGKTYTAAVTLGEWEPKLQDDGINFRKGQDAQFDVRKSLLPVAPEPKTEVTIDGIVFRIVHSGPQDKWDPVWHITARRYA